MADTHSPRPPGDGLPTGELSLTAPPPPIDAGGAFGVLAQLLGSLASLLLVVTVLGSSLGDRWHALVLAGTCLLGVLGAAALLAERRRWRVRTVIAPRAAYLRHLTGVAASARRAAAAERSVLLRRHPPPDALPSLAEEGSRVWERDDLLVRYAVSDRSPSLTLAAPVDDPLRPGDPELVAAVERLVRAHEVQPDLPAVLDLRAVDRVEVSGSAADARALARALVCAAVTFHSPTILAVGLLAAPGSAAHWDWLKWLPHLHAAQTAGQVADRHQLLVVDGAVAPPRAPGTTALVLGGDGEGDHVTGLRLVLAGGSGRATATAAWPRETPVPVRADRCDLATAEALARRLARRSSGQAVGPRPETPDLARLLDLDVRRLDPGVTWRRRTHDRLRVPIGLDDRGGAVVMDLKESAEGGMGPHGLVVGATGSGKSELLRTLLLALALTHSPEQLTLVLVDFKGGATFAGLSALPHVSALVTNLVDELALVDRMHDVLAGELVRRQELLRSAGHLASVRDHEHLRATGSELPPLPALLVVVDEFSELLSARPELVDLFVTIGRLGRSLGVHLLLASQRVEEGRLRGLESHLSYRIGLRTFSADDSRAVLGVPDACDLPPVPGLGLLRAGPGGAVRFRAAFVSGPMAPPATRRRATRVQPFVLRAVPCRDPADPAPPDAAGPALLDLAVDRLRGHGPPARRLWLPPLEVPDTLDRLMADLTVDPVLGLVSPGWRRAGPLTVPIGVVDRPRHQRRDPLAVRLADGGGHVAVVGAPRSGATTLLQSLVAALALTTTPVESQVYVLDLGAGTFPAYDGLPHVAGVAGRGRPDVVRRVVREVTGIVDHRESYFRDHGIDSMATYRDLRAQGRADDGRGDLFLVVDGWAALRADFEDLERDLQHLATRGIGYGCHLLTATSRWADYRPAMRDLIGTRVELRLGDPADSEVDRRAAALVPRDRPGRGLIEGPFHVLGALPRIDGSRDPATVGDGVRHLVRRVSEAWPGRPAPALSLLPTHLTVADLRARTAPETPARRLLLGVRERDLAPVGLDADTEPHWLVLGDAGSGRTTALRGYLHEVVRTRSPTQAQVLLLDPRRSLLGEVPHAFLLDHLTSTAPAAPALADLAAHLENRLPGPEVPAPQVRGRSWRTGAEVHVVVDDHDLLAGSYGSPLHALQPLLGQARDIGLHLVVARRSGGAGRAVFEPVLQTLVDLAAPVLLLSGNADEGPILGRARPSRLPPGRGRLVTRDGDETVQLTWRDPIS